MRVPAQQRNLGPRLCWKAYKDARLADSSPSWWTSRAELCSKTSQRLNYLCGWSSKVASACMLDAFSFKHASTSHCRQQVVFTMAMCNQCERNVWQQESALNGQSTCGDGCTSRTTGYMTWMKRMADRTALA